jgi:hypothetical protein
MNLEDLVADFVKEVRRDYVGLWELAHAAREHLGARTTEEARVLSLKIARQLYKRGLRPGDYDYGTRFDFWPDQGCQAMLDRIEREWISLGADPTHVDPICSFLRPPD